MRSKPDGSEARRPLARAAFAFYRYAVSPVLHAWAGPGAGCRFTPSCSEYALEAVERHGWLRGSGLAVRRIGRCQPWSEGGPDPVPAAQASRRQASGNPAQN
jgi:putative membrane protein insertion efficiency factor